MKNKNLKLILGIVAGVGAATYLTFHLVKTGVHISNVDGSVIWKQNWKYYIASRPQLVTGNAEDFDLTVSTQEITKLEYEGYKKLFLQ